MSVARKTRRLPGKGRGNRSGQPSPGPAAPTLIARADHDNAALLLRDRFRSSMRLMASSVTVVTSADEDKRGGLTATAVCSLSVDPPLVIVCINRGSYTHSIIRRVGRFCLNYLAGDQHEIARRFAQHTANPEDKFDAGQWTLSPLGNPVLLGSLATVECVVHKRVDEGTHSVFIGAVVVVEARQEQAPLVYTHSSYARIGGPA